jgi:hypothetical protein
MSRFPIWFDRTSNQQHASSRKPKKRTVTALSNQNIVVLLFAVEAALFPATAQASGERKKSNKLGPVIGATVTLSQMRASDISVNPRALTFTPSLTPPKRSTRLGILAGADFLASPLDVKLGERPINVIPGFAYIFLTPHIQAKFHPQGTISLRVLLGGGYTRYSPTCLGNGRPEPRKRRGPSIFHGGE